MEKTIQDAPADTSTIAAAAAASQGIRDDVDGAVLGREAGIGLEEAGARAGAAVTTGFGLGRVSGIAVGAVGAASGCFTLALVAAGAAVTDGAVTGGAAVSRGRGFGASDALAVCVAVTDVATAGVTMAGVTVTAGRAGVTSIGDFTLAGVLAVVGALLAPEEDVQGAGDVVGGVAAGLEIVVAAAGVSPEPAEDVPADLGDADADIVGCVALGTLGTAGGTALGIAGGDDAIGVLSIRGFGWLSGGWLAAVDSGVALRVVAGGGGGAAVGAGLEAIVCSGDAAADPDAVAGDVRVSPDGIAGVAAITGVVSSGLLEVLATGGAASGELSAVGDAAAIVDAGVATVVTSENPQSGQNFATAAM